MLNPDAVDNVAFITARPGVYTFGLAFLVDENHTYRLAAPRFPNKLTITQAQVATPADEFGNIDLGADWNFQAGTIDLSGFEFLPAPVIE